ncbi:hypothetical protein McanMca71_000683 [Microsporum canis]
MGLGRQRPVSGQPGDGTGDNPTPSERGAGRMTQEVGEEGSTEQGKDVHEDNGSDRHRDKRQKRDSNARLGPGPVRQSRLGTEQRTYLELQTERSEPSAGLPMHNPELYEQIQRDGEAGVYIGPGAHIVGRYAPQRRSDHTAGSTLTPVGDGRAGDAAETVISASATGTSSDGDELPAINKKRPHAEGSSGLGGNGNGRPVEGQEPRDGTSGENRSHSFDPKEWQLPQAANQRKTRDIGPEFRQRIVISSDDSHTSEFVRNGARIKERAHPPSSPQFSSSPDRGKRNPPRVTYTEFYQERLVKELRREFKRMGRRRLFRAFPPQSFSTRRIRTWSTSRISVLGNFGRTLASALPPRPQLTRPGRRVDLFCDIKQEDSPIESDPRQFPLPSIEEEPENEPSPSAWGRSGHPPSEPEPEKPQASTRSEAAAEEPPKRGRRQAAVAGRQKMLERTASPARRPTREPAARKTSVASPSQPQSSVAREGGRVAVPETIHEEVEDTEEEEAESSRQPKQATKGKARGRAPNKAPAKAKASKAPPKKPASKPKPQPRKKAAPKSKAVSKPAKGGATKKKK